MTYKAVLADLDGTINRGKSLIPGADIVYGELSASGIKWLFLSNNAATLASDLAEKITSLGLPVDETQVINSASALIREVRRNLVGTRIMVIGQPRLRLALEEVGAITTEDPFSSDIVVVALDTEFTYEKMKRAHRAIQNGAVFWATNMDPTYPDADGFSPGAGSVVASISTASGKQPERIFGKPSTDMATIAIERLGIRESECLVVGDRMDTDVRFAKGAGMASALVLTGATCLEDLSKYSFAPDYILESISNLKTLF
ncbi:MAG: HAD-IIA family hydrolase [Deltaproteobacteria bacterium]|nr:HAD-IIA family hydrolase [Deltaproteobacteria bacterium]